MSTTLYKGGVYIAPAFFVTLICALFMNRYYMLTRTELLRLDNITRSPVIA